MGEVARAESERGEVVLRRREDGALELRVNGVFVMDTVETSSERALARAVLAALPAEVGEGAGVTVLIGGLGLGYTLAEVLGDARVQRAVVAEIEPALVRWHAEGLVPQTAAAVLDPRTTVVVDDVRRVVAAQPDDSLDVVLLDVDNGPGYLVYDANAAVYASPFLAECRRRLRPGGRLAVWSASEAPELRSAMSRVFAEADELTVPVTLGRRETTYHVLVGRA